MLLSDEEDFCHIHSSTPKEQDFKAECLYSLSITGDLLYIGPLGNETRKIGLFPFFISGCNLSPLNNHRVLGLYMPPVPQETSRPSMTGPSGFSMKLEVFITVGKGLLRNVDPLGKNPCNGVPYIFSSENRREETHFSLPASLVSALAIGDAVN